MQPQQVAQEALLLVPEILLLNGIEIVITTILVILLVAFLYLIYVVNKRLSVDSSSVPQGERKPWLEYGSFFVVMVAFVEVIIGFLFVLGFLGRFDEVDQALGFLTAFFGAIVGLTGTYFGIKSSSDATAGAQKLAAANGGDTTQPRVLSTTPPDQAVDIPPDIHPTATFSKDMDPATISPTTFKLLDLDTGNQIRSDVVYNESTKVATFAPADPLQNGTRYSATITAGVKDKAGNSLAQDKTWHFKVVDAAAQQEPAQ